MLSYTLEDINANISSTYLSRGRKYFKQGQVKEVELSENGWYLAGLVQGNYFRPYEVTVKVGNNGVCEINGECSCPVGFNCKHVAAVLLAGLDKQIGLFAANLKGEKKKDAWQPEDNKEKLDYFIVNWLEKVEQTASPASVNTYPPTVKQRMLYLLDLKKELSGNQLIVIPATANIKKDGILGRWKNYDPMNAQKPSPAKFLRPNDLSILRRLTSLTTRGFSSYPRDYVLNGKDGKQLLEDMLDTERCFWKESDGLSLHLGEEREGKIIWDIFEDGSQRINCKVENKADFILPLSPPFYLDITDRSCGILNTDISNEMAETLLQAPPIKPMEVEAVHKKLTPYLKNAETALPRLFEKTETKKVTPVPHLHLFNIVVSEKFNKYKWSMDYSAEINLPIVSLSFVYEKNKISHNSQLVQLTTMKDGNLIYIKRDKSLEKASLNRLKKNHLVSIKGLSTAYDIPHDNLDVFTMGDQRDSFEDEDSMSNNWMKFSLDTIPELRNQGWQIKIEPDFLYNLVRPDDDWYTEIDDSSGIDWFEVELGVNVKGERLNLLPILLSSIRENPNIFEEMHKFPEEGSFLCHMPDGSQLVLPIGRIRTILSFLKDLYNFENLSEDGKLKLSRLEAADLAEFEAAMKAVNLRWFGGERVKQLGQKLKDFSGINPVKPPKNFKAELRHYQQEGLNWLQFLREYDLAGILADDMGLGKTVQTLAHLALEKENNRLNKPALVIAPTSVIVNWRLEAERFTPDLKVLTLHGAGRKAHFDKIKEHDVVLTTYPLLPRDKDKLLKEEYHTVILDEAQFIKNPKTKIAQVACQLKADHRLCLTGTPMENHLGELWSLFNFLLPGLLGDERQFKRFYRNPIEKEQDDDRRKALVRRIKPFMLRRTKDKVAAELPPKTEIVQTSELVKSQRDLYETIRVSMHEKVRKEIANKGLARSHIIVLDALLKLRQVCCDPRLLKIEAAKKVKHSVKLEQLMEMLPELIEEGRRILLFSQFTSMLTLIEEELKNKKIEYVKLTGQTRDRQTPIKKFQSGTVPIFMISLKAGGTGLNLTAADTVIHYDPWWNPAVENQATDRAHRIGQDKPVFVYKLITAGTVEEKIVKMQEKKKALAEGIFNPESKAATKLTAEDINALFEPIG